MRLLLQRVSRAAVRIEGHQPREIGQGLVILAGIAACDTPDICRAMVQKAVHLRIFQDENGNMNRSLLDVEGACLLVSQFTLYANSRKGRRPSFTDAAPPAIALPLYEELIRAFWDTGIHDLQTGEFGADMQVEIVNDGPVTIWLDSDTVLAQSRYPIKQKETVQ